MTLKKYSPFLLFCFCSIWLSCSVEDGGFDIPDQVNVRLSGAPQQLNPLLTNQSVCKQVEWQLFMPLLQFDAQTLQLYPVLAESLPVVEAHNIDSLPGGYSFTFDIRADARWDDGRPVTAEDIAFSWKLQFHPEIGSLGLRRFLQFIEDVTWSETNNQRITFYTNKSFGLAEAVIGTLPIYPKHIFDPGGDLSRYDLRIVIKNQLMTEILEKDSNLVDFATRFKGIGFPGRTDQLIGCGAYQIEEWKEGERIILNRKKDWWADTLIDDHQSFGNGPEKIIYHFVSEDATLATMLRSEAIDVTGGIDPKIFKDLKADEWMSDHFQFFTPLSLSYYFIAFQSKHPLLADPRTRRAIAHLMDIEESIEVAMNGMAERTVGPILPVKAYYNQELTLLDYDIEGARSLLSKSGWADSNNDGILDRLIDGVVQNFTLRYKYPSSNSIAETCGLLLNASAQRVGIEVILEPLEFSKLVEDTRARDFELYFGQWSQMPGWDDLRNIWHTDSDTPRGFNKAGFGDEKSDALIDSINVAADPVVRDHLYKAIQRQIYEAQPYIFLFAPTERIVIHKRFKAQASTYRPGYFEQTFERIE